VKFLQFKSAESKKIKRFQYAAIDDATRIKALKIYERHNQANAGFTNYLIIRTMWTFRKSSFIERNSIMFIALMELSVVKYHMRF